MDYKEINRLIVDLVKSAAAKGYRKSLIGTCLLGSSGYSPIIKMINSEDERDYANLGIKPLTNVFKGFGREIHIAIIDPENDNGLTEAIYENNMNFFDGALDELTHGMDLSNARQGNTEVTAKKNYDSVVDSLLEELEQ